MDSLRLQMNPHFIFNSLNSIRHLILKKDFQNASAYITGFARLLRLILQNSKSVLVPLADDLEALKLYLDFERRRFEQKFDFKIVLAEGLDPQSIQIQPLIIQPFVENAIWHGLMHRNSPGKVTIDVSKEGKYLKVLIEDNGVGRNKAQAIAPSKSHKSYGLSITRDRLALMKEFERGQGSYEIQDLQDERGQATGTRVSLKLRI